MPKAIPTPLPKYVTDLQSTYAKAQQDLLNKISTKSAKGNVIRYQQDLLKQVDAQIAQLNKFSAEWAKGNIPSSYQQGVNNVTKGIQSMGGSVAPYSEFAQLHTRAISQLVQNASDDLINANNFLGRQVKGNIRNATLDAVGQKLATGATVREARNILMNSLATQGMTGVRTSNGRMLNLQNYATMVARTTTREATNRATLNHMMATGNDFVKMSKHNTTCSICAPLEGRVYSISGTSADFPPLGKAYSGMYANIHPNCKHVLVPYIPDLADDLEGDKVESNKPFDTDPRSQAQIDRYNDVQRQKAELNTDRRQWERYRMLLPDNTPRQNPITSKEIEAVKMYSGDFYQQIRSGKSPEYLHDIESFIDKSDKFKGEIFRGMNVDRSFIEGLTVGGNLDMKGVSSWSSDISVAREFWSGTNNTSVLLKVTNPKRGVSIKHISSVEYEEEIMVSSKSLFTVKSINLNRGLYEVELEDITPRTIQTSTSRVPKTLSAFRAMKKANSEKFQDLQHDYRSIRQKYGADIKPVMGNIPETELIKINKIEANKPVEQLVKPVKEPLSYDMKSAVTAFTDRRQKVLSKYKFSTDGKYVWKRASGKSDQASFNRGVEELRQVVGDYIDTGDLAIRVNPEGLEGILKSGRIKSGYETGTGMIGENTANSPKYVTDRKDLELDKFGVPLDTPDNKRPLYGYISGNKEEFVEVYGDVKIVLKKDNFKDRVSYQIGDSYDQHQVAPFIDASKLDAAHFNGVEPKDSIHEYAAKPKSFASKLNKDSYLEAQIHSTVTTDDIDRVIFKVEPDSTMKKALEARGIQWVLLNKT